MSDPYQPPSSQQRLTDKPLYSTVGIVFGTFIGSLAAGVVMMYLNYRTLGRDNLAKMIAIWGSAIFLVVTVIASFVPFNLAYGLLFAILQSAIAFFLADRLQGDALRYHQDNAGAMHSVLRAAGVGFLTGMVLAFISLNIAAIMVGLTASGG
jgi:hypothetical protein